MASHSIPMKNRVGDVIAQTIVSPEDFEKVSHYKWHLIGERNKYASTKINKKNVMLHHLIIGKPEEGMVVDHINGNGLDNRRENLRHASKKQNSQNRSVIVSNKTSVYIGVSKTKNSKKYEVSCATYKLGKHEDEAKAARLYDICAYLVYGEGAKTNNLISFEEAVSKYKLEDILVPSRTKSNKDLPTGVFTRKYKGNIISYYAKLEIRKLSLKFCSKYFKSKEEAIEELNKFKTIIEEEKKKQLAEHHSKNISYNSDGMAVIFTSNGKELIVDNDLWHDLSLKNWWVNIHGYVVGTIDGIYTLMHQYLYKKHVGEIPVDNVIDHINNVRHDNRLCNLRLNTISGNSHNKTKTKNSSSKYYGVRWFARDKKWLAYITKDHKQYNLGTYKSEIDAARAYNVKAKELYGDYANLNDIFNDELPKD
jgi:HNH endonuclease/AP2 domain